MIFTFFQTWVSLILVPFPTVSFLNKCSSADSWVTGIVSHKLHLYNDGTSKNLELQIRLHEMLTIYPYSVQKRKNCFLVKFLNLLILLEWCTILIFTKLISAQHPPWSVLANFFLKKLKYKHSNSNIRAANNVPPINNKNADKNCSRANGSLVAFWSWSSGLHVPVIQNLCNLSRSPENINF